MVGGKGAVESMVADAGFWGGRRVFLTGHTGFKGGWLSLWLQRMGAVVCGFSLAPPTDPNLFELASVGRDMETVTNDIREYSALEREMRRVGPEVVFHLAAQPLVRRGYAEPRETYATNVMGTVNVLEAVRATPSVRVVVIVSSDKCYENREWVWGYRENEPVGGYDPYSSSKGCTELVVTAYRNSYFNAERYDQHGVGLASVRAGNVIGGGDWAEDRLVPDVLRACAAGTPAYIRNPNATRPWQHVLEPLAGYLMLAERLWQDGRRFGGAWNFGPAENDAQPVSWVVEYIRRKWGRGASWEVASGGQPHEAHYLKLDCAKARSELGWEPRWNLGRALDYTIAWYKAYLAAEDMRMVSLAQINAYCGAGE